MVSSKTLLSLFGIVMTLSVTIMETEGKFARRTRSFMRRKQSPVPVNPKGSGSGSYDVPSKGETAVGAAEKTQEQETRTEDYYVKAGTMKAAKGDSEVKAGMIKATKGHSEFKAGTIKASKGDREFKAGTTKASKGDSDMKADTFKAFKGDTELKAGTFKASKKGSAVGTDDYVKAWSSWSSWSSWSL